MGALMALRSAPPRTMVAGVDVADVAAATGDGFDIFVLLGKQDGFVEPVLNSGIVGAVLLDNFLGLLARNAESLAQAKGGDAVDDAKVDHFGLAAHFAGDVGFIDTKDAGGCGGVDIFAMDEGFAQSSSAMMRSSIWE